MSILGNKPEDKFKKLFLNKRNSKPEIAFDKNDFISSYIAYLLTSVNLEDKDFGIITSISKNTSHFVWRLSKFPFKLNFTEKNIQKIFNENAKQGVKCDDCKLRLIIKDNEHYKKSQYSVKIEDSIKKGKNICSSCIPNIEAIISQNPKVFGYEDFVKLKSPINLEQPEKGFCKILYNFLYEKLNKREIWGASNVSIKSPDQEYDVILLSKEDNQYKIFQIEIKFGNQENLSEDDYKKFLDKHVFLENEFKQDFKEISILSILFNPYNVETFYKKIESIGKSILPTQVGIISKALKEKRILGCFSTLKGKKELLIFLKKGEYQNILEHVNNLQKLMK